jgi:hypothetical protein
MARKQRRVFGNKDIEGDTERYIHSRKATTPNSCVIIRRIPGPTAGILDLLLHQVDRARHDARHFREEFSPYQWLDWSGPGPCCQPRSSAVVKMEERCEGTMDERLKGVKAKLCSEKRFAPQVLLCSAHLQGYRSFSPEMVCCDVKSCRVLSIHTIWKIPNVVRHVVCSSSPAELLGIQKGRDALL